MATEVRVTGYPDWPRRVTQGLAQGELGLTLTGFVSADELELHAAKPFAMQGAVYPMASARLRFQRSCSGGYEVAAGVLGDTASACVPCDALTLEQRREDFERRREPRAFGILAAGGVPVSATPAGTPEVVLKLEEERGVHTYESRAGSTHISIWADSVVVDGWVPTKLVTLTPQNANFRTKAPRVWSRTTTLRMEPYLWCEHSVALHAEAHGRSFRVGQLAAGEPMELEAHRWTVNGRTYVTPPSSASVTTAPGVRLYVLEAECKPCWLSKDARGPGPADRNLPPARLCR